MEKVDITKKYRTRDGREVKLFTTESRNDKNFPVIGEVWMIVFDKWVVNYWTESGNADHSGSHDLDLIEVKEKKRLEGFLPIQKDGQVAPLYDSIEAARQCTIPDSIAAIIDLSKHNIEYEIGEGIEP